MGYTLEASVGMALEIEPEALIAEEVVVPEAEE
jgi:hypothetical protein